MLYYALGTLLAVPLIAYGILRAHLFDIDLRIRWTIKQSTLAAAVVAIIYALSEGASRLLSSELGSVAGLLAAALVVFFLAPLQRFADRVASAAMPNTQNTPEYAAHRKLQVYESAVAEAMQGGGISEKERALLNRLRDTLGDREGRCGRDRARPATAGERDGLRSKRDCNCLGYPSAMPVRTLFPTMVYEARLPATGWRTFNRRLLQECLQTREDDVAGQRWSATRYPGGYTSYGSLCRMHTLSPTFAALERKLRRHVQSFARALEFDLEGRELAMTDCWINVMPRLVVHSLHLHPLSTISGTYYVRTPRGAPASGSRIRGSTGSWLHHHAGPTAAPS